MSYSQTTQTIEDEPTLYKNRGFFPDSAPSIYGLRGISYYAGGKANDPIGQETGGWKNLRSQFNFDRNDKVSNYKLNKAIVTSKYLLVPVVVVFNQGNDPSKMVGNQQDSSYTTYLVCFEKSTGAYRWHVGASIGNPVSESFVVINELNIVVLQTQNLLVLDLDSGEELVNQNLNGREYLNNFQVIKVYNPGSDNKARAVLLATFGRQLVVINIVERDEGKKNWMVSVDHEEEFDNRVGAAQVWSEQSNEFSVAALIRNGNGRSMFITACRNQDQDRRVNYPSFESHPKDELGIWAADVSNLVDTVDRQNYTFVQKNAFQFAYRLNRTADFGVGMTLSDDSSVGYLVWRRARKMMAFHTDNGTTIWETVFPSGFTPTATFALSQDVTDFPAIYIQANAVKQVSKVHVLNAITGDIVKTSAGYQQSSFNETKPLSEFERNNYYAFKHPIVASRLANPNQTSEVTHMIVYLNYDNSVVGLNAKTLDLYWAFRSDEIGNENLNWFSNDDGMLMSGGQGMMLSGQMRLNRTHEEMTLVSIGCPKGSTGFNCLTCQDGYYFLDGVCQACPSSFTSYLYLGFFVIMIIAVFVFARRANSPKMKAAQPGIMALIDFIQLTGTAMTLRIPYPGNVRQVINFFSFAKLNIDAAAPECTWKNIQFYDKYIFFMSMPALLIAACIVVYGVLKLLAHFDKLDTDFDELRSMMVKAMTQLLIISFLPVVTKVMQLFDCTFHEAGATMDAYPSVICFTTDWDKYLVGAILGIIYLLITTGTVVTIVWLVRKTAGTTLERRRDFTFLDATFVQRFGFLFERYKPMFIWWELTVIVRKTLVVGATLFWTSQPLNSSIAMCIIFFNSAVTTFITRPYMKRRHTLLDCTLSICTFMVVQMGIVISNAFRQGDTEGWVSAGTAFLVFFFFGLGVGVLVVIYDLRSLQKRINKGEDPASLERGYDQRMEIPCLKNLACFRRRKEYTDEPELCRPASWQPKAPVLALVIGTIMAVVSIVMAILSIGTRQPADALTNGSAPSKTFGIVCVVMALNLGNLLYYPGADVRRVARNRELVWGIGSPVRKFAGVLYVILFIHALTMLMNSFTGQRGAARLTVEAWQTSFTFLLIEVLLYTIIMHLDYWFAQYQTVLNWMKLRGELETRERVKSESSLRKKSEIYSDMGDAEELMIVEKDENEVVQVVEKDDVEVEVVEGDQEKEEEEEEEDKEKEKEEEEEEKEEEEEEKEEEENETVVEVEEEEKEGEEEEEETEEATETEEMLKEEKQ